MQKPLPTDLMVKRLVHAMPPLSPSVNYCAGKTHRQSPLPQNFLLFSRESTKLMETQIRGPQKQHHRTMIIYGVEGHGHISIDSDIVKVTPGVAALVRPFQSHLYSALSPDLKWLFITFEYPELPTDSSQIIEVSEEGLTALRYLIEGWSAGRDPERASLWIALLLNEFEQSTNQPQQVTPDRDLHLLRELGSFFRAHLHSPFVVADAAKAVGLSVSHLHHRFRVVVGRPLGAHIRYLRLRKACGLLHATTMPVTEIALQCGFDSLYSFSRSFKVAFKVSPSAYRHQHEAQRLNRTPPTSGAEKGKQSAEPAALKARRRKSKAGDLS